MLPLRPEVVVIAPIAVRIDTAARMCEVSRVTIYSWIKTGKLRTVRVESDQRVLVAELDQFLKDGHGDSGKRRVRTRPRLDGKQQ
jgi:excisionase family DNA binding protein